VARASACNCSIRLGVTSPTFVLSFSPVTMFGFMSRYFSVGSKRIVTTSPTLAASAPQPRPHYIPKPIHHIAGGSSALASAPPSLHVASFRSLAFPPDQSVASKSTPTVLFTTLHDFASPSFAAWALPARHNHTESSGFTVRGSFELVQKKQDWDVLERIHRAPPKKRRPIKLTPIGHAPHLKGVVLKTMIKKPKKPNSANRKCVLVRLSNGKECVAFVPGEGHNLQEHSTVLVKAQRSKDLVGVRVRVVRGKYDCAPVKKKVA